MIFEIETAVKAKLEEIPNFHSIYDHFTLNTAGYPYASFELANFAGDYLDTCTNERDLTFNIMVIQEVGTGVDRNLAKTIIYKCLEQIIEKFDGEQDLGEGTIVRGRVSSGEVGTFQDKEGSILALSVDLTLTTLTRAA